jgi:cyclophilin family peptidyl-prolyl cis-trans isomerase
LTARILIPLLAVTSLLLGACGQAAPPAAAPTATRAPTAQSSAAQVAGGLSPLPKPSASASVAASPAAQGAPVTAAPKQYSSPPAMQIDQAKHYTATIDTSMGTMKADLFASDAPITVNNFVFLAREGFYNGAPFHRIIKDFMVQTGDSVNRNGTGGPGYRFQDEPVKRPYEKGTLAMANAGPNTNGSQFFIVQGANVNLPPNYTIFGKLTDGVDTLDKIANVPVGASSSGERSKPQTDVTINSIKIDES